MIFYSNKWRRSRFRKAEVDGNVPIVSSLRIKPKTNWYNRLEPKSCFTFEATGRKNIYGRTFRCVKFVLEEVERPSKNKSINFQRELWGSRRHGGKGGRAPRSKERRCGTCNLMLVIFLKEKICVEFFKMHSSKGFSMQEVLRVKNFCKKWVAFKLMF